MSYAFKEGRLWDWAVDMAKHMSKLSKDPSTKVGAVIFDDKRRLVGRGLQWSASWCDRQPEAVE